MKSAHCANSKQNENNHNDDLSDGKRRLALRWSNFHENRHFLEELCDQNEDVEIECEQNAYNEDLAPRTGEMSEIESVEGSRQRNKRDDADADRGSKTA